MFLLDIRTPAKAVLDAEAEAIRQASGAIDSDSFFTLAVHLSCLTLRKAVVTGVGKSGIVARKLASTLATSIIPAVFIDPVALFHGELGALAPDDLVILVSHSGETEELTRLIPFVKQKSCRLAAIVGNANSVLGRLPLALHTEAQDDPIGRMPTASSAAAVAIGDALAHAAALLKGVDTIEMARAHPGGTIGRDTRHG